MRSQLLTKEQAAQIAAEFGLHDLDAEWWTDQVDQRKLSAVVVKRRRRFLSDHVYAVLEHYVDHLRALDPIARRQAKRRAK